MFWSRDVYPTTFWKLAMHDKDNFFVENDFGRYSIGSTTEAGSGRIDYNPNPLYPLS
jgi:hypothetical protein